MDGASLAEAVERRFAWQARILTFLVGASGFYMVARLDLWDRFEAIGYWWMHAPRSLYPMANGGEAMVLYCFVFLYIAAVGSGPWSLDASLKRA